MKLPNEFEFSPDEDQLLLMDENIVLGAVETKNTCLGCWFNDIHPNEWSNKNISCPRFFKCVDNIRKDKKDIIWIEVK